MSAQSGQCLLQGVGCMGIVDYDHRLIQLPAQTVHPPRHRMHQLHLVHDAIPWHAEQSERAGGGE